MLYVSVSQIKPDKARKTRKNSLYFCLLIIIFNLVGLNSLLAQNIDRVNQKIAFDRQLISNPFSVEGIGGGTLAAADIVKTKSTATGYCDGFVARRPNHILTLSSFFEFLKIEVQSTTDATILIAGPGGVWCNDDFDNANPTIEGQWQPGTYKIWVGSYRQNINNNYRIKITDLRP